MDPPAEDSCTKIVPTCWCLVLAGGKFCKPAEQNYSPVEGETTAVAKGLEDTKRYSLGCRDLYVATDHSSLVNILGDQSLADIENPRLARIKEGALWWKFKIVHMTGKKQLAADATSRRNKLPAVMHKVSVTELDDDEEESAWNDIVAVLNSVRSKVMAVMNSDKIKVITWDRLYEATQ